MLDFSGFTKEQDRNFPKRLMDLKTLAEFTTLLVSGNPVISQAQGCQTTMELERAVSML